MYQLRYSNRFKKDIKKLNQDTGFEMKELEIVLDILVRGEILIKKYRNHKLKGDYAGYYECHIRPDVLLVYEIDKANKMVFLFRVSSHSELFG